MEIEEVRLVRKEKLTPEIFAFDFASKTIIRKAQPGQFVQIQVNNSFDPFLRRPFSLASVSSNIFRIVFRVRGKGTKILSQAREDDYISVLGPLGQPIPNYQEQNIILVGGGIGIAPLFFLTQRLVAQNYLHLYFGARNRNELIMLAEFKKLTEKITIATEDGSLGKRGKVTDLLTTDKLAIPTKSLIFACGPIPMLNALQKIFTPVPVYGFLEQRLGCGTGLCFGCAVKKKTGGYLRLCKDGPVVNLNEIEL